MRTFTLCLLLSALLPVVARGQYVLLEDAINLDNGCIQLTPDTPYSRGIAYNKTKLNLNTFFEIDFDIYLGNKEEGADGITFVMHNDHREFQAMGTWGECMGYGRWRQEYATGNFISPSIAVEFDTYFNYTQNDPDWDHVAYLENGTNFHTKYWSDNRNDFNLEDNKLHDFRFRWDPEKQLITVFLDGKTVFQGKRNLVKDIFNGNAEVIWGFTASTGRASNQQLFCLKRITQYRLPSKNLKAVRPVVPRLSIPVPGGVLTHNKAGTHDDAPEAIAGEPLRLPATR
jgi:hypothetical protein